MFISIKKNLIFKKIILLVVLLLLVLVSVVFSGCANPFAPALVLSKEESSLLGNQKTVEGLFMNFQYAYNFKDTIVYSNLLDEDFIFTYTNYDAGVVSSWSRPEDMLTTSRLFLAANKLDLLWNDILSNDGDNLRRNISRSFNLTIIFSSSDVVRLYGKANFGLKRDDTSSVWKLTTWRDESSY